MPVVIKQSDCRTETDFEKVFGKPNIFFIMSNLPGSLVLLSMKLTLITAGHSKDYLSYHLADYEFISYCYFSLPRSMSAWLLVRF